MTQLKIPSSAFAPIPFRILSGLAEGQILQRSGKAGATANLAGSTAETGPVSATIFIGRKTKSLSGWSRRKVGVAMRGKFTARLAGVPAGGPYRLELRCGAITAGIAEFFVGDVWLLAGQSNMAGQGNRTGAAKPHPLIRSFSMAREWRLAKEPLHVVGESPDVCHHGLRRFSTREAEKFRRTVQKGVGPGLFFARDMLKRTGVPQGLICTAHGGTTMAQWDPALKNRGEESLYASTFASLRATGQPVAGVLWYQGESDANPVDALLYTGRMKGLVAAVRRDLRQPRLPWVIVQIARLNGLRSAADAAAWNSIQEQQRRLPERISALETVAALDLALDDGCHISAKDYPRLAARLARALARLVHFNRGERRPPRLRNVSFLPDRENNGGWLIDIHFDDVIGKMRAEGKPSGFALVNSEGGDLNSIFKTTLRKDAIRLHVHLPQLKGMHLHYGLGCFPYCNITDGRDEALPAFGPIAVPVPPEKPNAVLPFVTTWRATGVITGAPPLEELGLPEGEVDRAPAKTSEAEGFFNEHALWTGKSGQAYFMAKMTLPEPMRLEFLIAYDGPFRLWLDRQPFFIDMNGINPCTPDKTSKTTMLAAGEHDLRIAMDTNKGYAWGFRLRFKRKDVTRTQIKSGDYAKPTYSV